MPLHNSTSLFMYADDVSEVCPVFKNDYVNSIDKVMTEFHHINDWSISNRLCLNSEKTRALCFRKKNYDVIFPFPFSVVENCKLLGVIWNERLLWTPHFDYVLKCASKRLYILRVLKQSLPHDDLWHIFDMTVMSLLLYSSQLFGPLDCKAKFIIQSLLKRAKRLICVKNCACDYDCSFFSRKRESAFRSLHIKSQNPDHPLYPIMPLQSRSRFNVPFCATSRRQNAFPFFSALLVNNLCNLTL